MKKTEPKIVVSHYVIYALLLALYGQTGFLGGVWTVLYWLAVVFLWIALFGGTLILAFLAHPNVQSKFRLNVDTNVSKGKLVWGICWGTFVACLWWFYMNSPWMAAGSMILMCELTFLRAYTALKRVSY